MRGTDSAKVPTDSPVGCNLKSWHMVTYAGLAQFKQEEPEKSNSRSATNHISVMFQSFQHVDKAQVPQNKI
jgi:hypothetical protein